MLLSSYCIISWSELRTSQPPKLLCVCVCVGALVPTFHCVCVSRVSARLIVRAEWCPFVCVCIPRVCEWHPIEALVCSIFRFASLLVPPLRSIYKYLQKLTSKNLKNHIKNRCKYRSFTCRCQILMDFMDM